MRKYKEYIISVLLALGVGGLSAFLTRNYMNIYEDIIKPPLSPPMIVFPIVWSVLFILMGISSARVYKACDGGEECGFSLKLYAIQLVVNFFWSIIFFRMRAFLFAFIWLILLLVLVIWMIIEFYKTDKTAAYLQIPYVLWLLFAGYLSLIVYILN